MSSKLPAVKVRLDERDYIDLKGLADAAETSMSKLVALMVHRTIHGHWVPAKDFERLRLDDIVLPRLTPEQTDVDPLLL